MHAGVTTFQRVEDTNPRDLELIVNRHPPFGNQVREAVRRLPKYELCIDQVRTNGEMEDLLMSIKKVVIIGLFHVTVNKQQWYLIDYKI